ncbi:hypothetical protein MYX19_05965, partial [Nitrospinae bacterium AH-259-F20]|nr:hypothetical protein [Nitrospinae bacterium AH-259-F20]
PILLLRGFITMLFIHNFHNLSDFLNDFLGENVMDKLLRSHFVNPLLFLFTHTANYFQKARYSMTNITHPPTMNINVSLVSQGNGVK